MLKIALIVVSAMPLLADADGCDDFDWKVPITNVASWALQSTWLNRASPTATAKSDGKAVCFMVEEPGHGMKWSAALPNLPLVDLPYLVLRYRAENLDTSSNDYLLYLCGQRPGSECNALRLCDLVCDGRWHTVAVNVNSLARFERATMIAMQVQAARQGKARLWLTSLSFQEMPPKDATMLGNTSFVPSKPNREITLAALRWSAHSTWLSNPASDNHYDARQAAAGQSFRVAAGGRGMKWSARLPETISLEGHRYLSMRYRARHLKLHDDYTLCALGRPHIPALDSHWKDARRDCQCEVGSRHQDQSQGLPISANRQGYVCPAVLGIA